jgi:hypothetical protein
MVSGFVGSKYPFQHFMGFVLFYFFLNLGESEGKGGRGVVVLSGVGDLGASCRFVGLKFCQKGYVV